MCGERLEIGLKITARESPGVLARLQQEAGGSFRRFWWLGPKFRAHDIARRPGSSMERTGDGAPWKVADLRPIKGGGLPPRAGNSSLPNREAVADLARLKPAAVAATAAWPRTSDPSPRLPSATLNSGPWTMHCKPAAPGPIPFRAGS